MREGGEESDQATVRLHDPECATHQMRPVSVRRREIGEQRLRDVLALEGRGGGQFDARKLGKIGVNAVADMYGSGSYDDRSVSATAPFGPRPIVDSHITQT